MNFLRMCPGSIISRPQLWTFVNKNQASQLERCDWLTGSRVGTPTELCCQAKWDTPDFYDILIAINLQLQQSNETQLCNKGFREMFAKIRKELKTKFLSFTVYATMQDEVFTAISALPRSWAHSCEKSWSFSHVNCKFNSVYFVGYEFVEICH